MGAIAADISSVRTKQGRSALFEPDEPPVNAMRYVRSANPEDDQAGADRQTNSLAALAAMLFLVVVCLALVRVLHRQSTVEDCLLSGRTNCAEAFTLP